MPDETEPTVAILFGQKEAQLCKQHVCSASHGAYGSVSDR